MPRTTPGTLLMQRHWHHCCCKPSSDDSRVQCCTLTQTLTARLGQTAQSIPSESPQAAYCFFPNLCCCRGQLRNLLCCWYWSKWAYGGQLEPTRIGSCPCWHACCWDWLSLAVLVQWSSLRNVVVNFKKTRMMMKLFLLGILRAGMQQGLHLPSNFSPFSHRLSLLLLIKTFVLTKTDLGNEVSIFPVLYDCQQHVLST